MSSNKQGHPQKDQPEKGSYSTGAMKPTSGSCSTHGDKKVEQKDSCSTSGDKNKKGSCS